MFEVPPPGDGFTTEMEAVPALAMSEAGIVAVSCVLATKVVVRGLPFQFTVDALTNPPPFTVRVNAEAAGAALTGTRGWFMNGTGLVEPCAKTLAKQPENTTKTNMNAARWLALVISVDIRSPSSNKSNFFRCERDHGAWSETLVRMAKSVGMLVAKWIPVSHGSEEWAAQPAGSRAL